MKKKFGFINVVETTPFIHVKYVLGIFIQRSVAGPVENSLFAIRLN